MFIFLLLTFTIWRKQSPHWVSGKGTQNDYLQRAGVESQTAHMAPKKAQS